jgi:hypothetical protein
LVTGALDEGSALATQRCARGSLRLGHRARHVKKPLTVIQCAMSGPAPDGQRQSAAVHRSKSDPLMSALGHSRRFEPRSSSPALRFRALSRAAAHFTR